MNDEASDVVGVGFEGSDLLSSVVVPDSELEIVGTWEGKGGQLGFHDESAGSTPRRYTSVQIIHLVSSKQFLRHADHVIWSVRSMEEL